MGVYRYLNAATWAEIRDSLGLSRDCPLVSRDLLFVVGRNVVHFSGEHRPDEGVLVRDLQVVALIEK